MLQPSVSRLCFNVFERPFSSLTVTVNSSKEAMDATHSHILVYHTLPY